MFGPFEEQDNSSSHEWLKQAFIFLTIRNLKEWCVQYGVLDSDAAHKAYKKVLKRKEIAKSSGYGSKSPPPPSKKKKKSKKGKSIVDDVEFDAGLDAGGDEGIGTAVM